MVKVFADLTPRNILGYIMAPIMGKKGLKDTLKYCQEFLKDLDLDLDPDLKLKADSVDSENILRLHKSATSVNISEKLLDRLLERLKELPIQLSLIPKLRQRLIEGYDNDVLRMQPFAVAAAWNADRSEVLRLFLYATKVGLLNMNWELICPNCRVPKAEYERMNELSSQFHCDTCGIDYKADLDNYVEVRFSVHPAVRQAEERIYCIGGPFNTPHILVQQCLMPQEERNLSITLIDEPLRLRAIPYNQTASLEKRSSESPESMMAFYYDEGGWNPASQAYSSAELQIKFQNRSSKPLVAVIERTQWDQKAATAAYVTSFQEFRDLFSSEVLAPGHEIEIKNLSILFSDLKGSTVLYESIGDAPAYSRVREHFDFLINTIKRNQGAIVKTIGDAVMAVFALPQSAAKAAMEIQTNVAEFNRTRQLEPPIIIKLGVHHGHAIAVNANDRLDYFGRTVNIAARIQRESYGSDLVLTHDFFGEPEVQEVLKSFEFKVETFTAELRGIEGEFELCRILLN